MAGSGAAGDGHRSRGKNPGNGERAEAVPARGHVTIKRRERNRDRRDHSETCVSPDAVLS